MTEINLQSGEGSYPKGIIYYHQDFKMWEVYAQHKSFRTRLGLFRSKDAAETALDLHIANNKAPE